MLPTDISSTLEKRFPDRKSFSTIKIKYTFPFTSRSDPATLHPSLPSSLLSVNINPTGDDRDNADDSADDANREASFPSAGCTGNANAQLCQRIRHAAQRHDQTVHSGAIPENDRLQLCRSQAEGDPTKFEERFVGKDVL